MRKLLYTALLLLSSVAVFSQNTDLQAMEARLEKVDGKEKVIVKDTGLGIAKEDQKKIFKLFEQVKHQVTIIYN